MLSERVQNAMNNQITHEMHSAYLYLSMAAYFEDQSLPGMARWMRLQFEEEKEHALKFFDHLIDRGARVKLQAIPAVEVDFASPLQIFEKAYAHEQKVTGLINDIYNMAREENDYASMKFLDWFIEEQVEEEKSTGEVVAWLKMVGDSPNGLLHLDLRLGKRKAEED